MRLDQMIQEALSNDQATCKYDEAMSLEDIQAYIWMNFSQQAENFIAQGQADLLPGHPYK